jgi:putative transcriptional regulator
MRKISAVIIFFLLGIIVPGIVPAEDVHYDLLAVLKTEPPSADISPKTLLVNEPKPAKGSFLVATRRLKSSFFSGAVIILLKHNDQGSIGLVMNRPSPLKLSTVFPDVKKFQSKDDTIYTGGPVELTRFFILIQSENRPPDSQHLMDNIYVTSNLKTLKYMHNQSGRHENIKVFAGTSL